MRIAIIAPLYETVPPSKYGGTERVVHFIAEELVRLGHTVSLYAASGSKTSGKVVECFPGTLREHGISYGSSAAEAAHTAQLELAMSTDHDIIHIHHGIDSYHPKVLESIGTVPIVWTDHNAVHNEDKPISMTSLAKLDIGMTALSESHRSTVPDANWLETIHHGLPIDLLNPTATSAPPSYLAFLGRISPEKGITTAVRIAESGGLPLKVAAKIDNVDRDFYENEVKPLLATSNVDFIGEISDAEKSPYLSAAMALIFPICWMEPFGLVMIEAMACGCPVIAFRMGSVPEVIEHGVTGFIVDTEEEAVEALQHIGKLDRRRIRQRFEERFTSNTMARKYVDVYEQCIVRANALSEARELARAIAVQEARLRRRPLFLSDLRGTSIRGAMDSLHQPHPSPVATFI